MDPQQRIILECAAEAWNSARLSKEQLHGSDAGVFIGCCNYDWTHVTPDEKIQAFSGTGSAICIIANRISYVYGLRGPSFSVDTACSSALVALDLARQKLTSAQASPLTQALVGGVNLMLVPQPFIAFCKARMLAQDARCKSFDARADGYGRGEGCGCVVLKRLEKAKADGNWIWAVLMGTCSNHVGKSASLTAPNGPAQADAVSSALSVAGVRPTEVVYVEAHGTGTPLGDPVEFGALQAVLGSRQRTAPVIFGAVKTNIGHLEGASGIAGLIKACLALRHMIVPANLHFRKLNPHIETDLRLLTPVFPVACVPLKPSTGSRWAIAGVSSFGFGGANAHAVLQEPSAWFSAESRTPVAGSKKLAFLFTGQGAQYHGMGRVFYDREDVFRKAIVRCSAIAQEEIGVMLESVLYGDPSSNSAVDIDETLLAQPATFAVGFALLELWDSRGVRPDVVIGHSLGEYIAAVAAGVMPVEDAMRLVARRARIMHGTPPGDGVMAACRATEADVLRALHRLRHVASPDHPDDQGPREGPPPREGSPPREGRCLSVAVASVNGPKSVVISGKREEVNLVLAEMGTRHRMKLLSVSHAFHSPLMKEATQAFREAAIGEVCLSIPKQGVTFISTVTGGVASAELASAEYWIDHILKPVRFADAITAAVEKGVQVFLELGPHPTLSTMGKQCVGRGTTAAAATVTQPPPTDRISATPAPPANTALPGISPSVPVTAAPLTAVPLTAAPLTAVPLTAVPLTAVPLTAVPLTANSSDPLCGVPVAGSANRGSRTPSKIQWLSSLSRSLSTEEQFRVLTTVPAALVAKPLAALSAPWYGEQPIVFHRKPFPWNTYPHPVLGTRTVDGESTLFRCRIRGDARRIFEQHVVQRAPIMPGMGLVELMAAAVSASFGADHLESKVVRLDNVTFERPLVLLEGDLAESPGNDASSSAARNLLGGVASPPAQEVVARVCAASGDVSILVRADEESEEQDIEHASARIRSGAGGLTMPALLDIQKERGAATHAVDVAEFYQNLADAGLQYGPEFRCISALHAGDDVALCQLERATDSAPSSFRVHPAMLDGALQAAGAVLFGTAPALVPFSIQTVWLGVQTSSPLRSLEGVVKLRDRSNQAATVDVQLSGPDGKVVAAFRRVRLRQLDLGSIVEIPKELLWRVTWVPMTTPVTTPMTTLTSQLSGGIEEKTPIPSLRRSTATAAAPVTAPESEMLSPLNVWCLTLARPEDEGPRPGAKNTTTAVENTNVKVVFHPLQDDVWAQIVAGPATADIGVVTVIADLRLLSNTVSPHEIGDQAAEGLSHILDLAQRVRGVVQNAPHVWVFTRCCQGPNICTRFPPAHAGAWAFCRAARLELEAATSGGRRIVFGCVDLAENVSVEAALKVLTTKVWCTTTLEQELLIREKESINSAAGLAVEESIDSVGLARLVVQVSRLKAFEMPVRGPVELKLSERGAVANLSLRPLALRETQLPAGTCEIRVRAVGLNFRDVLNVMGLYPGDPGPPGGDCAGTVAAVGEGVAHLREGDAVYGVAPGCLKSFVVTDAQLMRRMPRGLTFEAAAALPVVGVTVEYSLGELAKVKRGDIVLVHAASGGVGLLAIQLCHRAGATVIGTVGSERKEAVVRARGVGCVASSRDVARFRSQMHGKRVTVVLNCLTGEFIEASLNTLAPGGRFIEIGKRDIWTAEQIRAARPDVSYHTVAVDEMMQQQPQWFGQYLETLAHLVEAGTIQPIPLQLYDMRRGRALAAFRAMQRATHIGKVVIKISSALEGGASDVPASDVPASDVPASDVPASEVPVVVVSGKAIAPVLPDSNKTVLIFGGTGALGRVVAAWLIREGVGCVVLLSRSGGRQAPAAEVISETTTPKRDGETTTAPRDNEKEKCCGGTFSPPRIVVKQCDVSDVRALERCLVELRGSESIPPIRGIIHAAGALADMPLESQTVEHIRKVVRPKVHGAWNLHKLLGKLGLEASLEFFLVFSSISAVLGNFSQTAYAAANGALDALVEYRRSCGLRAASLQWGPWLEQGMASHLPSRLLVKVGMKGLRNDLALRVLDDVLLHQPRDVASRGGDRGEGQDRGGGENRGDLDYDDYAGFPAVLACQAIQWRGFVMSRFPGGLPRFFELTSAAKQQQVVSSALTAGVDNVLAAMSTDQRRDLVKTTVFDIAQQVMGDSAVQSIVALDSPLSELGLDSLGAVEFRNALQTRLGVRLPATVLFDYPTLNGVIDHIEKQLADLTAVTTSTATTASSIGGADHRGFALVHEDPPLTLGTAPAAPTAPVAVVGAGLVFPRSCESMDSFWDMLSEGTDCVGDVPLTRFDVSCLYDSDADAPNGISTRQGAFVEYGLLERFGHAHFAIPAAEVVWMDPQQRALLDCTARALRTAGLSREMLLNSPTGVFIGCCNFDWHYLSQFHASPFSGTGTSGSIVANRISYVYGLKGPSYTVDTACSSSLVAVESAIEKLAPNRRHHASTANNTASPANAADQTLQCVRAIVGGVNIILTTHLFCSFTKARMLSPDCRCKTFDRRANGYVRGEGVAVAILEPLTAALERGRVLAVVKGAATNHDGRSASLTAPNGPAQQEVIRAALRSAGREPSDICYVESHGTGTPLGDPIEVGALAAVFRARAQPLVIGALKTNIGHLEGAAGIAGLLKVVLCLNKANVPRNLHFQNINPLIDLSGFSSCVFPTANLTPLSHKTPAKPQQKAPLVAGVSAFGFGGANCHVVLEAPPAPRGGAFEARGGEARGGEARGGEPAGVFELAPTGATHAFVGKRFPLEDGAPASAPAGMGGVRFEWCMRPDTVEHIFMHHCVAGRMVAPAMLFLESIAACSSARGHSVQASIGVVDHAAAVELQEVEILRPLFVRPPPENPSEPRQTIRVSFTRRTTATKETEVFAVLSSKSGDYDDHDLSDNDDSSSSSSPLTTADDYGFQTHATAKIVLKDLRLSMKQMAEVSDRLREANERCCANGAAVSPTELYAGLADAGLQYGPRFRTVKELTVAEDVAVAKLALVPANGQLMASCEVGLRIHPAILDGTLHAAAALLRARDLSSDRAVSSEGRPRLLVPTAVRSAVLLRHAFAQVSSGSASGSVTLSAVVRLTSRPSERVAVVDVLVVDGGGGVVADLQSVRLQQVKRLSVQSTAVRIPSEFLWKEEWVEIQGAEDGDVLLSEEDNRVVAVVSKTPIYPLPTVPGVAFEWLSLSSFLDELANSTNARRLAAAVYVDAALGGNEGDANGMKGHESATAAVLIMQAAARRASSARLHVASSQSPLNDAKLDEVRAASGEEGTPPTAALPNDLLIMPVVWIVTRCCTRVNISANVEPHHAGIWGIVRSARLETETQVGRAIPVGCIDVFEEAIMGATGLISTLIDAMGIRLTARPGGKLLFEPEVAIKIATNNQPTLLAARFVSNAARKTVRGPVEVHMIERGAVSNLITRPLADNEACRRTALPAGTCQIRVRAVGLNFRDVLNVMGLYPGDPGPPGGDCAGTVLAVGEGVMHLREGDAVYGVAPGCLKSFIVTDAELMRRMPQNVTFAAAAALPVIAVTVEYALRECARVQAGETVLIHAASGGVGTLAVQLCKRLGARVIATVGSPAKSEFVKALGADCVTSSRDINQFKADTSDAAGIDAVPTGSNGAVSATGSNGAVDSKRCVVDVVLNSLIGEFIPASLSLLRRGGRFVELGKREVYSEAQMREARPDVAYTVIAIDTMIQRDRHWFGAYLDRLRMEVEAGRLGRLPVSVFNMRGGATDAFRFLQSARHIGKVVLVDPTITDLPRSLVNPNTGGEEGEKNVNPSSEEGNRENGCYVVTGGTGGLGTVVAEWLGEEGARRIVLLSRSAVPPPTLTRAAWCSVTLELSRSRVWDVLSTGTMVYVLRCNVGVESEVTDALRLIREAVGPVRGIFHAAGVLEDRPLEKQTRDTVYASFVPKSAGAWNLHRACSELSLEKQLDAFVVFSSISAAVGNFAQANYAAANAQMDALVEFRRAKSLVAQSIQWGPWVDQGMAAKFKSTLALAGLRGISNALGRRALSDILLASCPLVTVVDRSVHGSVDRSVHGSVDRSVHGSVDRSIDRRSVDDQIPPVVACQAFVWPVFLRRYVTVPRRYLQIQSAKHESTAVVSAALAAMPPEEAAAYVERVVIQTASEILRVSTPPAMDTPLHELGIDSLGAVEFRNSLARKLGVKLPATTLFDYPTLKEINAFVLAQAGAARVESAVVPAPRDLAKGRAGLAIVGAGCRLPGDVHTLPQLWAMLQAGTDCMSPVPLSRWNNDLCYSPDPDAKGKMYVQEAAFVSDAELFANGYFGVPPAEVAAMDPQQRLMLEVSCEAFSAAGFPRTSLGGLNFAVVIGCCNIDWHFTPVSRNAAKSTSYSGTGGACALMSNRLSYCYGLKGPSVTVDTACSSSLVAVSSALGYMQLGQATGALVGGVNLMLTPQLFVAFCKARMLSPDSRCKTFDASANGYARGEGCAAVVLLPLQATETRPVLGVITGAAINHDGRSASLTAPNGPAQQAVIRAALGNAGLVPRDVDCIESHGTGTPLGDPIEVGALRAVFGGRADPQPLVLGALKTNIGHLEGAAGVAGLLKLLLCLRHGEMPRNLHFTTLNPHIDVEGFAMKLPVGESVALMSRAGALVGGVSSFGFGGSNAHVTLQVPRPTASLSSEIMTKQAATGCDGPSAPFKKKRVMFVYTGQGAQYLNMGKELFRREPVFRNAVELCDRIASRQNILPFGVLASLFPPEGHPQIPINNTGYAQPLLFVIAYALTELLKAKGLEPDVVLGHSHGEHVAALCAGVFSLETAMQMVSSRAVAMAALPAMDGAMVVARVAEQDAVNAIARLRAAEPPSHPAEPNHDSPEKRNDNSQLGGQFQISLAAVNAARSVVLSGPRPQLELAIKELGVPHVKYLAVSHGFHSPLMTPALEQIAKEIGHAELRPPKDSPVWFSTVTGRRSGPETATTEYWVNQICSTVRFFDAIVAADAVMEDPVVVEISPRVVLTPLIRQNLSHHHKDVPVINVMDPSKTDRADSEVFSRAVERIQQRIGGVLVLERASFPWVEVVHPLVGKLTRGARKLSHPLFAAENEGDNTREMLADHIIKENVLMPAAGFIEALAAAAFALYDGQSSHRLCHLEDIAFTSPMVLQLSESEYVNSVRMEVVYEHDDVPTGPQEKLVLSSTFTVNSEKNTVVHAECVVRPMTTRLDALARCEPLEALQRRITVAESVERHYAVLASSASGLSYGPHFQTVKAIWKNPANREVLCRLIATPQRSLDDPFSIMHNFRIYPAVLDGAFQAAATLLADGGVRVTMIPVGAKVSVLGRARVGGSAWGHVRLSKMETKRKVAFLDVILYNEYGDPVAELRDVCLKAFESAKPVEIPKELFWETEWFRAEDLDDPALESAPLAALPEAPPAALPAAPEPGGAPAPATVESRAAAAPERGGELTGPLLVVGPVSEQFKEGVNEYLMAAAAIGNSDHDQGGRAAAVTFVKSLRGMEPDTLKSVLMQQHWRCLWHVTAALTEAEGVSEEADIIDDIRVLCQSFGFLSEACKGELCPVIVVTCNSSLIPTERSVVDLEGLSPIEVSPGAAKRERADTLMSLRHGALSAFLKSAAIEVENLVGRQIPLFCVDIEWDPAKDRQKIGHEGRLLEQLLMGIEFYLARQQKNKDWETSLAIRDDRVLLPRLQKSRVQCMGPVEILMLERGAVSHLRKRPQAAAARLPPPQGCVELRVRSIGLNFRDVLNVMGLYPGDPGPPGSDFAGTVLALGEGVQHLKVGDAAYGVAPGCLKTFVTTDARFVARMPSTVSFEDAAALPVSAVTVEYCLRDLASVKKGDRVLIHAASGGVGMLALQFCARVGAEVYATVGSERKETFLREALGIEKIASSRDPQLFDKQMTDLLSKTGPHDPPPPAPHSPPPPGPHDPPPPGPHDATPLPPSAHGAPDGAVDVGVGGVDVVLNCLIGDFIPNSLKHLREGGHFIELGKRGAWSAQEIAALRPDVRFSTVAIDVLMEEDPQWFGAFLVRVRQLVEQGEIKCLPLTVFEMMGKGATDGVGAFRYMQRAQHIGKVVIKIPSCLEDTAEWLNAPTPNTIADVNPETAAAESSPNAGRKAYLVTGGSGGLGGVVAKWLIEEGATAIILASRRGQMSDAMQRSETWRQACDASSSTVKIIHVTCDVSSKLDVQRLVAQSLSGQLPRIVGIFHAAGVLADDMLDKQTHESVLETWAAKAAGAWNLHEAFAPLEHETPLEVFTMFSSVAALLGNFGQTNYAAANGFLDALAKARRAKGLAGQSIQWGPWTQQGMAAALASRLDSTGLLGLSNELGLRALYDLSRHRDVATVVGCQMIKWRNFVRRYPKVPPFFGLVSSASAADLQLATFDLTRISKEDLINILAEVARQVAGPILRRLLICPSSTWASIHWESWSSATLWRRPLE